jgi:HEPN domain-containing protein
LLKCAGKNGCGLLKEFNIEFATRMSEASFFILDSQRPDADRAAIYMALVACEIALKSVLESAGVELKSIPKTHNLSKLLKMVSKRKVLVDIGNKHFKEVSASRLRGVVVDANYANATVGNLMEAEQNGASVFPNEIRYGAILKHYPALTICKLGLKLVDWVKDHQLSIK